jgi:transaldolase
MMSIATPSRVDEKLRAAAEEALRGTEVRDAASNPAVARLRELGTELWLDTGNLDEARGLWTREFAALTTNNTLANQVVQTGVLDKIAAEAVKDLQDERPDYSEEDLVKELGFVVNCHIALRLVKAFGAMVSVELHPDVADNIDETVDWAERYFRVCPERFYVKIPLTPEGYCAVARTRTKGIPVNYTLGFSARQNYLAAVLSNPTFCNVFLGRLNQVVLENRLGDGKMVGEKAAMTTQVAVRELREAGRTQTRLIAASMRSAAQVRDLAGADVYTMPPKVAKEFMDSTPDPAGIQSGVGRAFDVELAPGVDPKQVDVLWTIDDKVKALTEDLARRGGVNLTGDDLRDADAEHGTKLFHRFTSAEVVDIQEQGKIPDLDRWEHEKNVSLDTLMTESALQSFAVDQAALDEHLQEIVRQA